MGRKKGVSVPHKGDRAKFAKRGPGAEGRPPPLPASPTIAMPGTKAKFLVMCARIERGEQPHHPFDAKDSEQHHGYPATENTDGFANDLARE